jgi:uncharacterized protein YkwD
MKSVILFLIVSAASVAQAIEAGAGCTNGTQESIDVCEGLNRIRSENRAAPVHSDRHLTQVAMAYAKEMYANHNLSHGNFTDRMNHAGVPNPRGENIAHGQRKPEEVLRTWKNSPGHFANMINPNYKTVGIGYYQGYWVQIFSGGQP